MSAYLISYDLNKPGQNYSALHEKIKSLGGWCHCLESTWVVTHPGPAVAIRDALTKVMDSSDALFVAKLTGEAAWIGLFGDRTDWLKKNL